MRKITLTFGEVGGCVVVLGFQGENEAAELRIDCAREMAEYGGVTPKLYMTRADGATFDAAYTLEEGVIARALELADTACAGAGSLRVTLEDSAGRVVSTARAPTVVLPVSGSGQIPAADYYHVVTYAERATVVQTSPVGAPRGYVPKNSAYSAALAAASGCVIDSVTVKMGGTDITATAWNAQTGTISIPSVGGNLQIRVVAVEQYVPPGMFTVTKDLSHCALSNSADAVAAGSAYATRVTADAGYTLFALQVTMGGADITAEAWNNAAGTIRIAAVTNGVRISAWAAEDAPQPGAEVFGNAVFGVSVFAQEEEAA